MTIKFSMIMRGALLALGVSTSALAATLPQDWPTYFKSHPEYSKLRLGVRVKGAQAYSSNENVPMLPASNEKIITSVSALKVLGPDYRFTNTFDADLDLTTFTAGNVVLSVSGDPTWGNSAFEGQDRQANSNFRIRLNSIVAALKAKGITQVSGAIQIKLQHPELDMLPRSEGWKPTWNLQCMAMMQTSFILNGNCGVFQIYNPKSSRWVTDGVDIPVSVDVTVGKTENMAVVPEFDSLGRAISYHVSGVITSAGTEFELPVNTSSRWLKNLFLQVLDENQIAYSDVEITKFNDHVKVDLSSLPLSAILDAALSQSINGVLDRIFYEVAFHLGLSDPTTPSYSVFRELVQDDSLLTGIEFHDGSGLDVRDRMRPDALYSLLIHVQDQPYFKPFFNALAVGGVKGTLKNRTVLKDPLTLGKVFAKTGTLSNANNISGYFVAPDKALIPFVVLSEWLDPSVDETFARHWIDSVVLNIAAQNTTVPGPH